MCLLVFVFVRCIVKIILSESSMDTSLPSTAVTHSAHVTISAERLKQLEYIEANYESIIERSVLDRIETEKRNRRMNTAHSEIRANIPLCKHLSTSMQ